MQMATDERNATHVMVDLETMASSYDAAIVSVGAVVFTFDGGVTDKFYERVSLQSSVDLGLTMSPATVLWWLQQSDGARNELTQATTVTLRQALESFSSLLAPIEQPRLWGNGATFDNVILRNAYDRCGLKAPWSHTKDRCYRTVKNMYDLHGSLRPSNPAAHNALADAETQAMHLIRIMNQ